MSNVASRPRRLRGLVLAAVFAVLAVPLAGTAGAAPAPQRGPALPEPIVTLNLTKVKVAEAYAMVHAEKRLFVSMRDEVRVLKENGKVSKRVKHLPGARGMVVSPKGDRLYVALRDASQIAVIDTRRLKVVKRFRVAQCPTEVALTGGRLFYAHESCDDSDAAIESIDPRKGGVPVPSGIPLVSDSILLVGGGDTLVTGTRTSSSQITSYRVVGGAATVKARHQEDSLVLDLATSPDGSTVYVPNNPSGVRAFPSSTLADPVTYPTGGLPLEIAASRDGRQIAAFISESTRPDLFTFSVGSTTPSLVGATAMASPWRPGVYSGTLTFSGNGKRVFALRADTWDGPTYLVSAKTGLS